MDPITHALSGAILYKTYAVFSDIPQSRWAVPLVMLATASPDLDVLYAVTPLSYIANHRGLSHSIFAAPFFAFFLTFLMFPMWKKSTINAWTFKKTYLFAITLILLHIWLDVVTTYGTMIFMPLSDYRVRLNGLFIIDLLLTLPMIFAFFYCKVLSLPEQHLKYEFANNPYNISSKKFGHINKKNALLIAVCIWILAYPAISVFWRLQIEEQQLSRFASEDKKLLGLTVLSDVFSPLNWRVIYSRQGITKEVLQKSYTKDFMEKYPLNTLNTTAIANFLGKNTVYEQGLSYNGEAINSIHSFPAANSDLINMLMKSDESCNVFLKFTMLPIQEIKPWGDGFEFSFYDLRFNTLVPFAQKIMHWRNMDGKPTFLLQVRLNKNAQLVAVRIQLSAANLDSGWNSPKPVPKKPFWGIALSN